MKAKKLNYVLFIAVFLLGYCVISTAYNIGKKCALRDNAEAAQLKNNH